MTRFVATITPSYVTLRSLYLEASAWETQLLEAGGKATVLLDGDKEFSAEGKLNPRGGLSGMAKLYKRLGLSTGMSIEYTIPSKNTLVVYPPSSNTGAGVPPAPTPSANETVFERKKLKHIHLEAFRPENLNHWEPETEPDVYLAFGVLQEFTDFQYCCGASKALLQKLGAISEGITKPDAILIDRATDQYLMAEWKMRSSDFSSNHKAEDIDVLVCWIDDETDKGKLPPRVLALKNVARQAAESTLDGDAG
ncbi:hypothetical protein WME94_34445 [Sorangium sp. So ce429]